MSRKPSEFLMHPVSFPEAQAVGLMRAVGKNAIDGDKLDVLIDLGFLCYAYEAVRLRDFEAPERAGVSRERAIECRARVASLTHGQPLLIRSYQDTHAIGAFAVDVLVMDGSRGWRSLVELLLAEGWYE
ncbi:MAG TPA: hypothetical protein VK864_01535 [Longimicrobiales bacterium]|nr:hypothetical protein [Longimicrobiales bacterium]